jgi:hypothetical protein
MGLMKRKAGAYIQYCHLTACRRAISGATGRYGASPDLFHMARALSIHPFTSAREPTSRKSDVADVLPLGYF